MSFIVGRGHCRTVSQETPYKQRHTCTRGAVPRPRRRCVSNCHGPHSQETRGAPGDQRAQDRVRR